MAGAVVVVATLRRALSDGVVGLLAKRRGYSAAATHRMGSSVGTAAEEKGVGMKKKNEDCWVPDPVTGYYRPASQTGGGSDAAELREVLLSHNQQSRH